MPSTIFRADPTTDAPSAYNALSALTWAHPTAINNRWRKKTVALRTKCLSRAWAAVNGPQNKTILERRSRLSDAIIGAKPISELEIDQFLYSCINIEQLAANPAALLNLVCSRAVRHPSGFGREDYRCFVKPVLELFGLVGGDSLIVGKIEVVTIGGGESEYGVLKTHYAGSSEYTQAIDKMVICPRDIEGMYLMRWQKTILEFCLAVVKDVMSPFDPIRNPPIKGGTASTTATQLLENVPNYSSAEGDLESYSASILLRPYILPPTPRIADIRSLAVSHLRAAEDHLDLLHTSSNYFIAHIENQLTQWPENVPGESPLAAHNVLRYVIYNAYATSLIWSQICLFLEDAELDTRLKADLFNTINSLLTLLEAFPETALKLYFLSAGEVRGEDVVNSLLICLHTSNPSAYSNWLTLSRVSLEIEHALVDHPELKPQVDAQVMDILSSIASISEVREALCQLEPGVTRDNEARNLFNGRLRELSCHLNKIELGFLSDIPGLHDWIAANGLEIFWKRISVRFVELSGKSPEAWVKSKQGRSVDRKMKGRWHWGGNVWMSDKIEGPDQSKKQEENLPELIGIAEWDDAKGYGELSPARSNGEGVPKTAGTLTHKQRGYPSLSATRRGIKLIVPDDVQVTIPDPTKKISLSKRMHSSIMQLSSGTPLPWKDFIHLITHLGFMVEHIGGTLVRLIPSTEGDETMIVKRPHPGQIFQSLECVTTWARLDKCYGWKVSIFEKEVSAPEVKTAG